MIIFLCVCDDRSAAWRLWNHKTHHRIAGWWTPALFSFLASLSRKMWISFLGRLDWRVPHHCYVCFPPKFFFWECCRTTLFYECVRCKLPFRSLENKIYLMGLYTSSDLFFLWNAIYLQGAMTSMQSELIITICSHRVVPLRCKRVTQWERIQYHVVNAAFWDWWSGANSQGVAITWGNQITPQTRHFWKPLNSPSFTWACRDPSAQRGSLHELFVVGTSQSAGVSEAVTTHTLGRPEPPLVKIGLLSVAVQSCFWIGRHICCVEFWKLPLRESQ